MNKNRYRVIFSQARNMLVVVADIARSNRASTSPAAGLVYTFNQSGGEQRREIQWIGKINVLNIGILLAFGLIQPLNATIRVDNHAPANQHATLLKSANGTPQVNIQTPSAGGVSRNSYSQFDVDHKGVILNNSRKMTSTQLGGWVGGNPWLAQGEAKIILNEVNTSDPSKLNGYIEVAGQQAQVVIANPSGISCHGCGFINTPRATLTTGQPQLYNGNLTGFNVEQGEVIIAGTGMNSSQQNYTDIIARSVKINAGLWAQDLKITVGANQVDAAHQKINKQHQDHKTRPPLAIDVAQLGGMYAGKIRLMGTEKGVGVHHAGMIGAQAGTVVITSEGNIENSGKIHSRGDLTLTAKTTINNNRGELLSASNMNITSDSELQNSGIIAARKHTQIQAGSFIGRKGSTLMAGANFGATFPDSEQQNRHNLSLTTSGRLVMQGKNIATGNIHARGQDIDASHSQTSAKNVLLEAQQGELITAQAQVTALQQLTVSTRRQLNNDGGALIGNKLTLSAQALSNQQGKVIQFGDNDLRLHHQGKLNNRGGKIANQGKNLSLNAAQIINQDGLILHNGDGKLTVETPQWQGKNGKLLSNGQLHLSGGHYQLQGGNTEALQINVETQSLSNRGGRLVQSGRGKMVIHTQQAIDNQKGYLAANGKITLNAATLHNQGGSVIAAQKGDLNASIKGKVENQRGMINTAGDIDFNSGALNNDGGLLHAGGNFLLDTQGQSLSNRLSGATGVIRSRGRLEIKSGALDNEKGRLIANGDIRLQTGTLKNSQGILVSGQQLTLDSLALDNSGGLLQSGGDTTINTHGQRLDNSYKVNKGRIISQGKLLKINSGALENQQGIIVSFGQFTLESHSLNNQQGALASANRLQATTLVLNNQGGVIESDQKMILNTQKQQLDNRNKGKITANDFLQITSGDFLNQAGTLLSRDGARLEVAALDNSGGKLTAWKALTLYGKAIDNNDDGLIQSGGEQLNITSDSLSNRHNATQGGIRSQGTMTIETGTVDNTAGLIISDKDLKLTSATVDNQQGTVITHAKLNATTLGLDNQNGLIKSTGDLHWNTQQQKVKNQSGTLHSLSLLHLDSADLNNQQGTLSSVGALKLNSQALDNSGGLLFTEGEATINTYGQRLTNNYKVNKGRIISRGALKINSGILENQQGLIGSFDNVTLESGTLNNRQGILTSKKTLFAITNALDNQGGTIRSDQEMTLNSQKQQIDNREQGIISANKNLKITSGDFLNNSGTVSGGDTAQLDFALLDNRGGTVNTQKALTLGAGRIDNDNNGLIQSSDRLNITSDSLSNRHNAKQGGIRSQGEMTIETGAVDNTEGFIFTDKDLKLISATVDNQQGTVITHAKLNATTFALDNQNGLIQSTGDLHWDTLQQQVKNQSGTFHSQGLLHLESDKFNNQQGILSSVGDLKLNSQALDNSGGLLFAEGEATINTYGQQLTNNYKVNKGRIISRGALKINSGALENQQGLIGSFDKLTLESGRLNNRQGILTSKKTLSAITSALDNQGGIIKSGQKMTLNSQQQQIDNGDQGIIKANDFLQITSGDFLNQEGTLLSGDGARLDVAALDNRGGKLVVEKALTVNGKVINNDDDGLIKSGDQLKIISTRLNNRNNAQQGGLHSQGEMTIETGAVDNTKGLILTQQNLKLIGATVNNQQGTVITQAKLNATTLELDNQNGLIQSAGDLHWDTQRQQVKNQKGTLLSLGLLHLDSADLNNQQGTLAGVGDVKLNTRALDNSGGLLKTDGNATINTHGQKLTNNKNADEGGIISRGQLNINSGALENQQGLITSFDKLTLESGTLNNRQGILTSAKALSATTQALDNQGGAIKSAQEIILNSQQQQIDNREQGIISANKNVKITSGDFLNNNGTVSGRDTAQLDVALLDNSGGTVNTQQALTLGAGKIDNDNDGLIKSGDTMNITSASLSNRHNATQGGIRSQGTMTIKTGAVDNTAGLIATNKDLTLISTTVDNQQGTVITRAKLNATTLGLDNQNGLIQSAGDLHWNTQQQGIKNQKGTVRSLSQLRLDSADISNQQGRLEAKGKFSMTADKLHNDNGGQIIGEQAMSLHTANLDNQQGKIEALGNLLLDNVRASVDNTINNSAGLIRSAAGVTLNAEQLINQNTQGNDQGLEGQSLVINTDTLNNQRGRIRAKRQIAITNAGTLDNSEGLLITDEGATLNGKALALINRAGTVQTGQLMDINAQRLEGEGRLLSGGDINLISKQDITHRGEINAKDNLNLSTLGNIINSGKLLAANNLDLQANQLINSVSGEINAGKNALTVKQILTNQGLIDGRDVLLQGNQINNIGTGRIYGDAISAQATTFNNLAANGTAATLAGRERVDIATQTLNNFDHSLIYSDGDMTIGAALDENHHAIGKANSVNNRSSTLEAAKNMILSANQINNINDHFTTELVTTGNEKKQEYQYRGANKRYQPHEVKIRHDEVAHLNTIDGDEDNYSQFDFTRTVQETQIKESDPAKLIAGGDLTLYTNRLLNDKSQVVAGGALAVHAQNVDNVDIAGERHITDAGTVTYYYRIKRSGTDSQGSYTTAYTPPTEIQQMTLKPSLLIDQGQSVGNSIAIRPFTASDVSLAQADTGTVNTAVNGSHLPATLKSLSGDDLPKIKSRTVRSVTRQTPGTPSMTLPSTVMPSVTLPATELPSSVATSAEISPTALQLPKLPSVAIPSTALPLAPTQPLNLQPGQGFTVASHVDPQQGTRAETAVHITAPDTRLPNNSLFQTAPSEKAHYLIETDPRFTQKKQWLGSDYMQKSQANNADATLKRLGDGYYEQRLIREQVSKLTGQRYLDGYQNDEQQFKALMDAGVAFSKQYNLQVGVALSPEQMSLLTKDMVWLVKTTVTLPDGSQQKVLVPQVYARLKAGDLASSGALLAGKSVNLNVNNTLFNSGQIAASEGVKVNANNITNQMGLIKGAEVALNADGDINHLGGRIQGQRSLKLNAGGDINALSNTRTVKSMNAANRFERTTIDRMAGLYVEGQDGKLTLQAGRDIKLKAAQVINRGEKGHTLLSAGRDIHLGAVTTASRDKLIWNADNSLEQGDSQQIGSDLIGKGALTLKAGQNINAQAATLRADNALTLNAGQDIQLIEGIRHSYLDEHHKISGRSGGGAKITTTTHDSLDHQSAQGSSLSGDSVKVTAGNDLLVQGSNIAGTQDVNLLAGRDLNISSATERYREKHFKEEKKSGFMSSGGIGFSYGQQRVKSTQMTEGLSHKSSTLGSVDGKLTLDAGNEVAVTASELIAGQDILLSGKNINITAAQDKKNETYQREEKKSGLTLALSGDVGSAVNTAVKTTQQVNEINDPRLAALQATKAALSGVQAVQATRLAGNDKNAPNSVGLTLSYGSQSSSSTQQNEEQRSQGSSLIAGRDIGLFAADRATVAAESQSDILLQGSQLQAGENIILQAQRDIHLVAGQNTEQQRGENHSRGGMLGIGIGVGSGGAGLTLSAGVNQGRGVDNSTTTTATETLVNAGQQLDLISGRDANLFGAQVSGEKIQADIGRHLSLKSPQNSAHYDSKQQHSDISGSLTLGTMNGSAAANLSKEKMRSDYQSVKEQSGLFAGKGGFDINVGEHTQLEGAVISSRAPADKNRLDTGTLGFSDLDNRADFAVEQHNIGISTGGGIGDQFAGNMANNLLSNQNNQEHARSTTQAAVSEGALIIRNQDKQQQNLAELRRDVEQANPRLSAIFDKEKEQQWLKTAQLLGEIGNQASDIARTEGAIAAEKAQRNPQARETAKAALVAKGNQSPTETQITEQARHTAMADYGTGSALQQGMQAATAAIQGLAGGDLKSAIAGGSAPYLAEVIKKTTPDEPSRVMAHAVVAGALAQMQGNNPVAGASGAAAGEIAASVIKAQLYPDKNVSALNEKEKQTVSALSTLAAGLAGGIAGDSPASAVAGAQAGKTVVENNYLGAIAQGGKLAVEGCTKTPACRNKLIEGGLGALIGAGKVTSAVEQLSDNQKTNVMLAAMSGNADLIDKLSGAERKAYDELKGNQGLITVFPTPERDPTGGKLTNPLPDQNKGTALITPDQSGAQGASHTGNTNGLLDTGITTTTTPIADAPSRDELVYLAEGRDNRLPISEETTKQIIKAAEKISTAKLGKQFTAPRDLREQVLWNQVRDNPSVGKALDSMNTDPRFPISAGFQKMSANHRLADGTNIEIHYQYNSVTNKAYDMKLVTPKRSELQPGASIKVKP